MPLWFQHLLVILAAVSCAAFIVRQAVLSLKGRKSKLNGCGTCSTCSTPPAESKPMHNQRVAIIPAELLRRKR